jgi:hypothetical protein
MRIALVTDLSQLVPAHPARCAVGAVQAGEYASRT